MHCHQCKTPNATAVCGNCNHVAYCGKTCQSDDWHNNHQLICDVLAERKQFTKETRQEHSDKLNDIPSWLPTKKQIDAIPPIPSNLLKKLKSDYELRHVQRMRNAAWLESIVENIFKNALRAKGVKEESIAQLMSLKIEFEETYKEYAQNQNANDPKKMQILIRKFDLMLESLVNPKVDPTLKMQVSDTKSDVIELGDMLAHQANVFLETFPYDTFYKDDEETRSLGFEPDARFEGADIDELSQEEFMSWLISDADMKDLARQNYTPVGGFCDESDTHDYEEDDEIVADGFDFLQQLKNDPEFLMRNKKTYLAVRRLTMDRMNEIQRQRDDQGKMPADRRVANKRRKERMNQWKEFIMLIICGASETAGNIVRGIYNGALKAMYFVQPVDPLNATPEQQKKYGFTRRSLYTGMLVVTAAIGTAYFAYNQYVTTDNEVGVANLQKALKSTIEQEAKALTTSSIIRKQYDEQVKELCTLKETVGVAKNAQQILLDKDVVKNGGFLLSDDIQSAITQIDGPMAYVNEVSRFLGQSYQELKNRYAEVFGDDEMQFPQVAQLALGKWKFLSEKVQNGQSLKDLEADFQALAVDLQHSAEIYNPGVKAFLSHVEERLAHIITKFESMQKNHEDLNRQLENIQKESVAAYFGTTFERASDIIKSGATKGRFELPPQNASETLTPSRLMKIGENLMNPNTGMLHVLWETLQVPGVQAALTGSMFFGDNLISQLISISFTGWYALFGMRGGFRLLEIAFAGGAWALGRISDIFMHLARKCTDISLPDDMAETLMLQIEEISKSSGFFSSLGFLVCSFIATITRTGEVVAGGITALSRLFADSGVSLTLWSGILSVGILIAEAIAYVFIPPSSLSGRIIATKIPSIATWAIGMVVVMAFNGTFMKVLLTPYVQYADYRKSLPSSKLLFGGFTGGSKEFHWTEKVGMGFGIGMLSYHFYNSGMSLQSFVFTDYSRTIQHAATGVTTKTLGNASN